MYVPEHFASVYTEHLTYNNMYLIFCCVCVCVCVCVYTPDTQSRGVSRGRGRGGALMSCGAQDEASADAGLWESPSDKGSGVSSLFLFHM